MRNSSGKTHKIGRPVGHSRVTVKAKATIPLAVRKRLSLKPGDGLLFEESLTGAIAIRRAEPLDAEFLKALEGTLKESNSANDVDSYHDL
jgi:bifunctional DNA-binding transcriptional regulator/antitoxin component of YhaV-PrlF toxin-antitoxin module